MNSLLKAQTETLLARSKLDNEIIVGSQIREVVCGLRSEIERLTQDIERLTFEHHELRSRSETKLTFEMYSRSALRTRALSPKGTLTKETSSKETSLEDLSPTQETSGNRAELALAALGLSGESGEFADLVKKHLFHDYTLDRVKAIAELGDILWYLNLAATTLGFDLETVARRNEEKLWRRYPQGFSSEASINRKDTSEG